MTDRVCPSRLPGLLSSLSAVELGRMTHWRTRKLRLLWPTNSSGKRRDEAREQGGQDGFRGFAGGVGAAGSHGERLRLQGPWRGRHYGRSAFDFGLCDDTRERD